MISVGYVFGARGEKVTIDVRLWTHGATIAGTQSDISFDPDAPIAATASGAPDCAVNPAIGKESTSFAFLPSGCRGANCTGIRALVFSLTDSQPIADESVLYTCSIAISSDATLPSYTLDISHVVASDPNGIAIPATGAYGGVLLTDIPATPTPSFWPSPPAVILSTAFGEPGRRVSVTTWLFAPPLQIGRVQHDIQFDPARARIAALDNGAPDCVATWVADNRTSTFVFLPGGCTGSDCTGMRATIFEWADAARIFNNSMLYRCDVEVAATATGTVPLRIRNSTYTDLAGGAPIPLGSIDGAVVIRLLDGGVTPTHTAATRTLTSPGGPTFSPTASVTPQPTAARCGDGIVEADEECDDGGTCIGGENAGTHCTADAQCIGQGVCDGELNQQRCDSDGECPLGSRCVRCRTFGGDGCAANCTQETDVPFSMRSASVVVATTALTIPAPLNGSAALTIGKERNGRMPVVIKAAAMQFDPVDVGGLACACARSVAAKTCGGVLFEPGGVTPAVDCTSDESVCAGHLPCTFVHGAGNAAMGTISCDVGAPVNFRYVQDARAPGAPQLHFGDLLGDTGVPGAAVLFSSLGLTAAFGSCNNGAACGGGNVQLLTSVATLPFTTGVARAELLNAYGDGQNILLPSYGSPFTCGLLENGEIGRAALATAFTEVAVPEIANAAITITLSTEPLAPTPTHTITPPVPPPVTLTPALHPGTCFLSSNCIDQPFATSQEECCRIASETMKPGAMSWCPSGQFDSGGRGCAACSDPCQATPVPSPSVPAVILQSVLAKPYTTVRVSVSLSTAGATVAGVQNDIIFVDPAVFITGTDDLNPKPDCWVNPAIQKETTSFQFMPFRCSGSTCRGVRALVFSLNNTSPIPNGSVLYTCNFTAARLGGAVPVPVSNVVMSDPTGAEIAGATGVDGAIVISEVPTYPIPTYPIPTPTPTPVTASVAAGSASGRPGGLIRIPVTFRSGGFDVAGVQNDISFNPGVLSVADPGCSVNPDIHKELTNFAYSAASVRAVVVGYNVDPIPDGAVLYTCTFAIRDGVVPGSYPIFSSHVVAASAQGEPLPASGGNGVIEVPDNRPTRTPTATPTPMPPGIWLGTAVGARGQQAAFPVILQAAGVLVGGTQNDITFDPDTPIATTADGSPDCSVNPALEKESTAFAFLPNGCSGASCTSVRAVVFSLTSSRPIPDGSVLYTCTINISASANQPTYGLAISHVVVSDPNGTALQSVGSNGTVVVTDLLPPTPTPYHWPPGPAVMLAGVSAIPGTTVSVTASLSASGAAIAGVQNDIGFDPANARIAALGNGAPDCAVNPGIDKAATTFAFLPPGCSGSSCTGVRALIFALDNTAAIPDGATLYTCNIEVAATASGTIPLRISGVMLSDPSGKTLDAANGIDGAVFANPVGADVTPTNTAGGAPTATPSIRPSAVSSATPQPSGTAGMPTATRSPQSIPAASRTASPTPTPAPFTAWDPPDGDGCQIQQSGGGWLALLLAALGLVCRRRFGRPHETH